MKLKNYQQYFNIYFIRVFFFFGRVFTWFSGMNTSLPTFLSYTTSHTEALGARPLGRRTKSTGVDGSAVVSCAQSKLTLVDMNP